MPAIRARRDAFPHFMPLATRWMDNDVYGHVNNVQYYSYFDTAVNHYLITAGWLDIHHGAVVGLVVEDVIACCTPHLCHYHVPNEAQQFS